MKSRCSVLCELLLCYNAKHSELYRTKMLPYQRRSMIRWELIIPFLAGRYLYRIRCLPDNVPYAHIAEIRGVKRVVFRYDDRQRLRLTSPAYLSAETTLQIWFVVDAHGPRKILFFKCTDLVKACMLGSPNSVDPYYFE